ncbi:MAG: HD-GYP domain-containing protein, partial [Phycisphaerae bacterium]
MASQSTSRKAARSECEDTSTQFVEIDISTLRAGMELSQDLYDQEGVLLIAAGTCVTPHLLEMLQARGTEIRARSRLTAGDAILETAHTSRIDALVESRLGKSGGDHIIIPSREGIRPLLPIEDLCQRAGEAIQDFGNATFDLADVFKTLQGGGRINRDGVASIMNNFMNMIALDAHLLPLVVSMQQTPDEYLYNHCINVALISMTIAYQLGLDPAEVMEVGIGGLLADVGMLKVPKQIRLADRPLTPDERIEILRHPVYTLDFLERIQGLPLPAKFIGYQAHERIDASGYPRKRSGMLIHRYAKIVAVADSYAAMTGRRPHRPSLHPYQAAKQILIENSRSKFDREIVRAFLDCMSLFPIGSHVELSDGRRARVLRANPGKHTKPVVLKLD